MTTYKSKEHQIRSSQIDRTFNDGVWWLAQHTDNAEVGDAIRLLAYLTDTTEEWILRAVGHQQARIAANDAKVQAS